MATAQGRLDDMADAIIAARLSAGRLDAEKVATVVDSEHVAYAVQRLVRARARETPLGPAVGYKIGMSTEDAQQQFKIAEPISGHIFQSRLLESGAHLEASAQQRIGVECEIAVLLGAGLPSAAAPFDQRQVGAAVGTYFAGIEVLEDRFLRSDGASIWALAADDMLGFGGVIGAPLEGFDPFMDHLGAVTIDGTVCATGSTRGFQGGGPLFGLCWLANRLAADGTPLNAGDIVLCGGITPPAWIAPDGRERSRVAATIDGVSLVDFSIEWND